MGGVVHDIYVWVSTSESACAIVLMMNVWRVPLSSLLSAYTSPDLIACADGWLQMS